MKAGLLSLSLTLYLLHLTLEFRIIGRGEELNKTPSTSHLSEGCCVWCSRLFSVYFVDEQVLLSFLTANVCPGLLFTFDRSRDPVVFIPSLFQMFTVQHWWQDKNFKRPVLVKGLSSMAFS